MTLRYLPENRRESFPKHGRDIALRCPRQAQRQAPERNVASPTFLAAPPDASLGGADGAARRPYRVHGFDARPLLQVEVPTNPASNAQRPMLGAKLIGGSMLSVGSWMPRVSAGNRYRGASVFGEDIVRQREADAHAALRAILDFAGSADALQAAGHAFKTIVRSTVSIAAAVQAASIVFHRHP